MRVCHKPKCIQLKDCPLFCNYILPTFIKVGKVIKVPFHLWNYSDSSWRLRFSLFLFLFLLLLYYFAKIKINYLGEIKNKDVNSFIKLAPLIIPGMRLETGWKIRWLCFSGRRESERKADSFSFTGEVFLITAILEGS